MYEFDASPWLWEGEAAWHFVTLPGEISDDIKARQVGGRRGFGSVRVSVTVGATTWQTSVFPSKEIGAYILPLKKAVRVSESLTTNKAVHVALDPVQ
jgi:hypothetical protein